MNNKKQFKSKNKSIKMFFKKRISRILYFLSRNKKLAYIIITLVLVLLITPIILSFTFLSTDNNISKINFDKQNINAFDEAKMYNFIKTSMIGNNYYMFKIFDSTSFLRQLKFRYPIVKDINIGKNEQGEINVKLTFNNPSLIFSVGDRVVAAYSGEFFDISRSSVFMQGSFLVTLPDYLTDLDDFDGFFFKVDENTLKNQILQITKFFGQQNITQIIYYPGAIRTSVVMNDKRKIYFHNGKDITDQLNAYNILKGQYNDFDKVTEIDLAGMDSIIIKKPLDQETKDSLKKKRR